MPALPVPTDDWNVACVKVVPTHARSNFQLWLLPVFRNLQDACCPRDCGYVCLRVAAGLSVYLCVAVQSFLISMLTLRLHLKCIFRMDV